MLVISQTQKLSIRVFYLYFGTRKQTTTKHKSITQEKRKSKTHKRDEPGRLKRNELECWNWMRFRCAYQSKQQAAPSADTGANDAHRWTAGMVTARKCLATFCFNRILRRVTPVANLNEKRICARIRHTNMTRGICPSKNRPTHSPYHVVSTAHRKGVEKRTALVCEDKRDAVRRLVNDCCRRRVQVAPPAKNGPLRCTKTLSTSYDNEASSE